MLLVTAGLSALVTWHLALTAVQNAGLEREVVAAHVRSLLQDSPVQVASSDSHTVNHGSPAAWTSHPAVKDLTAEGFPLSGGRLDLVGDRRIAAVVYKRRQHVINVFMWPASGLEKGGPKLSVSGATMC